MARTSLILLNFRQFGPSSNILDGTLARCFMDHKGKTWLYMHTLVTLANTTTLQGGSKASVPFRPYVVKLAQHFEKLAQQILREWVKKMHFLDNLANFQLKLMILTQEPLCFLG